MLPFRIFYYSIYIYQEDFAFCTPDNYCFLFFTLYIDQSTGVENGVDESEFRNIQMCIVFANIKMAHLHTPFLPMWTKLRSMS